MSTPFLAQGTLLGLVLLAAAGQAQADDRAPLLVKHAGSYDTDALFKEPAVRAGLDQVVGRRLGTLMHHLDVRGSVDVVGGALAVSGNAPHGGGENEAVVCVLPNPLKVEAAIASKGRITVFAQAEKYEYTTLCVKDWITQFNSRHRDRFKPPANVSYQRVR